MNWLILTFLIMFVGCTMLSATMEGDAAFASTTLTNYLSGNGTTAYVASTTGFPDASAVSDKRTFWIGSERIGYDVKTSAAFGNLTRGIPYGDTVTTATYHPAESAVMSEEASSINSLLGFKIVQTETVWGTMYAFAEFVWTWVKAIPSFIMWDYPFLDHMIYIKPFLWAISGAFMIVFIYFMKRLLNPFG